MTRSRLITALIFITLCMLLAVEARAHPPWGISVDRQGRIYFSDLETIWKIDTKGKLSVFREGVGGRHTHELNLDEGGNLYGEDLSYDPSTQRYTSALWKMTPAGGFAYILAPTNNPPKGMSIWRDRDQNTYAALWNRHASAYWYRTAVDDLTDVEGVR